MTFQSYQECFKKITSQSLTIAPYDSEEYREYVKMNEVRQNRWLKNGIIETECIDVILSISQPQEWIIISEPWCGDAAQLIPFIIKLASYNSLIKVSIQLRDSDSEIEKYLTNGSKSIPILIVRTKDQELFHWGSRPKGAQIIVDELKNNQSDFNHIKEELQKWYNKDAGKAIQKELVELLLGK
jgi:hypothetical protein